MASRQQEPRYQDRGSQDANDDRQAPPESGSVTRDKWRTAIGTIELMTENLRAYLLSLK